MTKDERRALIIDVVENQLRDSNPPETRATLERLLAGGTERDEAMRLIACVVASEIFDVLKEQREFNLARYVRRLEALPAMPWETEAVEQQADIPRSRRSRRLAGRMRR